MRNDSEIKIFSGSASVDLTKKICDYLGVPVGDNQVIRFTEGNIYVKFNEKVRGKDVYIIQTIGLDPNNEFMELLFWIDACKRASVNSVTAIIPYFSYAKADKKDEPRVSIRARVCADCLEAAGVDRIITMDLHSPQLQGFFKRTVDHLYASSLFCNYIKSTGMENYCVVSPDEGFAKNARHYSNHLNVPLVIGNKQRVDHTENAKIVGLLGSAKGKNAVIVDDFTISCGTLIETANALKEDGALDIYAFVSHGLLSEKGVQNLEKSNIKRLIVTDTINNPALKHSSKITVLSVSHLLGQSIKIIHERESLGQLFI